MTLLTEHEALTGIHVLAGVCVPGVMLEILSLVWSWSVRGRDVSASVTVREG